jgi:glutamine cyclotransferase
MVMAGVGPSVVEAQTPVCSYQVIATFPHDEEAFTQGLLFAHGSFFESTGLYDESTLRRVDPATGQVLQIQELDSSYFGEGLALWEDRLIQLTWREQTGLIWDALTFEPRGTFQYPDEGWGLTHDGRRLIMSDGSPTLRFLDPVTFVESGSIVVTDGGTPVINLNELEWIRGEVFANQFFFERIGRIDPHTGHVIAWINLDGLGDPLPPGADRLNGIAWDESGERLFVTGKLWPSIFEIELVDCPELRLFFDGFERGDTWNWTVVTP